MRHQPSRRFTDPARGQPVSGGRWSRIVDWLGAQGAGLLSVYSCLIVAIVFTLAAALN